MEEVFAELHNAYTISGRPEIMYDLSVSIRMRGRLLIAE